MKKLLVIAALAVGVFFTYKTFFGSACCSKEVGVTENSAKSKNLLTSIKSVFVSSSTSGCTPSNCRGAKTKFGEAKVITELRLDLINLKSELEGYKKVKFEERLYSIHGIVGDTDEESMDIIVKEVKIIEKGFASSMSKDFLAFELPENKAKQLTYLKNRIGELKALL